MIDRDPSDRRSAIRPGARRQAPPRALTLLTVLAAFAVLAPAGPAGTDDDPDPGRDWPQFRGDERSGVSAATGLLDRWAGAAPKELWRRKLGPGFSSVSVADGAVYALFGEGNNEYAARLAAATGEEVWRTEIGPLFEEQFGNGPRSTPTVGDGQVYVLSSTGRLHALDATGGEIRWSADLQGMGAQVPMRGFSPSPLIVGELLLLETGAGSGKGVTAFDRDSGEVRWTAGDNRGGYSSPIAVEIDGVTQIVFVHTAAREVVSLLPDGGVHWTHPWPPGTIAMPVYVPPDRILVSASADVGAMLLKIAEGEDGPQVEEVWKNNRMKNHFSSSVYLDGHIYGFDNGTLRCLDAETGESLWAHRGLGKGSLIAADGLLFVLSDRGKLVLLEATPEEYRELGSRQVFRSRSWTAPALAGGKLFLRDHEEIVCLEVGRG